MALLASCGGASADQVVLTPKGEKVQVVTGTPSGCRSLGDVQGTAISEVDQASAVQDARDDLRNRAASLGATHVELQTNNEGKKAGAWGPRTEVTLGGVAHWCP